MILGLLGALTLACPALGQYWGNYNCRLGTDAVVHLFEWKWTSIASECENYLSGRYCAVQVSPPNEHRVITSPAYPWYQRYQPVSYKMGSRSGTETQFRSMVTRCNNVGVAIYVDAVINHMTGGGWGTGSDGSQWNGDTESYPTVPYGPNDFNGAAECPTSNLEINDYNNINQVRNCRLVGLRDLKVGYNYVRGKIVEYMNKLIGWGVAGFRIDASKHMWPLEIEDVFSRLNNLPDGTQPYIFMEVIDMGSEPIRAADYVHMGRVTEFKYGYNLGDVVRGNKGQKMAYLQNFGAAWGFISGLSALTFVDNHDNQRGHGAGGFGSILTFFEDQQYKIANAFMLAWNYGHVRVMSSYYWPRNIQDGKDTNDWIGPPSNGGSTKDADCFNGEWICEHRWRQISNMVRFHNVVMGEPVVNWWDNGNNAIAFGRGSKGFIVINNQRDGGTITQTFNTNLPNGQYCDVIMCDNNRPPCGSCERSTIISVSGGYAQISVPSDNNPVMAFHV